MKNILRLLALCLMLLVPISAMASGKTACYWQLEAIEVTSEASQAYGSASAETDVQNISETDPAAMTEIVRGVRRTTLDMTRAAGGYHAHGEYTLSGIPAVSERRETDSQIVLTITIPKER